MTSLKEGEFSHFNSDFFTAVAVVVAEGFWKLTCIAYVYTVQKIEKKIFTSLQK